MGACMVSAHETAIAAWSLCTLHTPGFTVRTVIYDYTLGLQYSLVYILILAQAQKWRPLSYLLLQRHRGNNNVWHMPKYMFQIVYDFNAGSTYLSL